MRGEISIRAAVAEPKGRPLMLNSNSLRLPAIFALAALALAPPSAVSAQTGYTISNLGTLGGTMSAGTAINATAQVAGTAQTTNNAATRAVRWTDATLTNLGTLGGPSYGYGVNDSGQVAGYANTTLSGSLTHAFRYSGATLTDLGTLGGLNSQGFAINASGQVTGNAQTSGAATHAVRWTGATATDLLAPTGYYTYGLAINTSGQVAGYAANITSGVLRAVSWTGTVSATLATLGGTNSKAEGINDSGQITGWANISGSSGVYHAVRWSGATITDLGTLGGALSIGYGINRYGAVVGYSDAAGGGQRAFLANGSAMTDLNALLPSGSGWVLTAAYAINDNGWITGQGTFNGQPLAYLLKPNPVTVSGRIALEGVANLRSVSAAAPLGTFRVSFRTPGTTTEVFGANVTLTTTAGSAFGMYSIPNAPFGAYDIAIKGSKNLRVLLPGVHVTGPALPDAALPAGDGNNDNSVDSSDFSLLIGAFNSDSSISGSGYNAAADFNFDGFVDSSDFTLLIGQFNNVGAP